MILLAHFMLLAWIPITMAFFAKMSPHRAVLAAVIGGWLLLPVTSLEFQGIIPDYGKGTAIAYGVLLGGGLSQTKHGASFRWSLYDLPMILFCLSPIPSSVTNGLGLYDGLANTYGTLITWGVPYYAGRLHFDTPEKLKDLCLALVVGGMVYAPLALWEIRMSPRLSINIYGFFPHEWRQHRRYGGWRPIVFLQHGLMVSLWFAASTTAAFWLWKSKIVRHIHGIPLGLIVLGLAVTTAFAKSANGWISLVLGIVAYFVYRRSRSNWPFVALLLLIPLYTAGRIYGFIEAESITSLFARVLDAERVGSLGIRLYQEELFVDKVLERFLFGWGRMGRAWPVEGLDERLMVAMIDSLWLIVLAVQGIFGLITWMTAILTGPFVAFRAVLAGRNSTDDKDLVLVLLGLIVVIFMVDSLVNAMVNPVYILSSGSLVSVILARDAVRMQPGIVADSSGREIIVNDPS